MPITLPLCNHDHFVYVTFFRSVHLLYVAWSPLDQNSKVQTNNQEQDCLFLQLFQCCFVSLELWYLISRSLINSCCPHCFSSERELQTKWMLHCTSNNVILSLSILQGIIKKLTRWWCNLLMTSIQEPNTMAPQSALCICLRKWKTKLIVPYILGLKRPSFVSESFLFRHWSQS